MELGRQPLLGSYEVLVGRTGSRPARRAVVEVRAQRMELLFRARLNKSVETLAVTAVWVHEKTDDPKAPLNWNPSDRNVPVTNGNRHGASSRPTALAGASRSFTEPGNKASATSRMRSCAHSTLSSSGRPSLRLLPRASSGSSTPRVPTPTRLPLRSELPSRSRSFRPTNAIAFRGRPTQKAAACSNPSRLPKPRSRIAQLGGWIGKRNGPPGSIATLARGLERLGFLVQKVSPSLGQ